MKKTRGGVNIYRNAIDVMAWDNEKARPIAYLATADNTSSKHEGPIGVAQAHLKMKVEKFIEKKWHWFGMRIVDPRILHNLEVAASWGSDEKVSILDIMAYLSMQDKDSRQSVSAYPWQGESFWVPTIKTWGLVPKATKLKPIYPFGKNAKPVYQEWWTGKNVAMTQNYIASKDDAHQALDRADVNDRLAA